MNELTSLQNPFVKKVAALKQKKYRDETGLFCVEGIRLVEEAIQSDWHIDSCIYTEDAVKNSRVQLSVDMIQKRGCLVFRALPAVYTKISDMDTPQGIMVVVRKKEFALPEMVSPDANPLLILLDGVQDPGNVGALLRTADAAGCSGVIMSQGCADLYAPKTVRATMGSLFHLPIIERVSSCEVLRCLQEKGVAVMATTLENAANYCSFDLTCPVVIVFGNEGNGISAEVLALADGKMKIPIFGKAESLNVGAAAAIILFEARRQRG